MDVGNRLMYSTSCFQHGASHCASVLVRQPCIHLALFRYNFALSRCFATARLHALVFRGPTSHVWQWANRDVHFERARIFGSFITGAKLSLVCKAFRDGFKFCTQIDADPRNI